MARCESRKQPLLLRLWRIRVSNGGGRGNEVEGTTLETIPENLFLRAAVIASSQLLDKPEAQSR